MKLSARWASRYLAATHWFIPAALQHEAATLTRAENVVGAALLAATAGPFYALAYYLLGFERAVAEILLCCAVMLASPLLLRASGSIGAARELFLCALFFSFTWLSYHLGGISAPTASWLITGPLVATFLGGVWSALFWLAMSCLAAGGIYVLAAGGHALPPHPVHDMAMLYLVCHLGLFVVVLAFALLFELTKTQGFVRLEQALGTITELAIRDELTGLLNQRLLRDRLRHAMERADRNRRLVALLLLNINKFKEVNDALGYQAGDALLVQAGGILRGCLRDCDSVARWSGDEFVALLEDLGSEADARQVAEKILDRFGLPLAAAGRECFITLSVGVALYPAEGCDLDALLKRADIAMRSARAWGENSVQLYSSAATAPQSERLALKNGLRDALTRGQLFLEYQPQFALGSRRIVGVEALLRWQHPVYGRIAPARFIALAEETGMIVPIGDWVLRTACLQNRAWRDAGLPGVKTAVNLSARQLRHPDLAARVLEIVRDARLPHGCLDLEITEGVLIDDLDGNQRVLSALRAAGLLVSIDDFGSGYSSLNYLSELPVDILKMDGLFVRRLGQRPRGRAYAIAAAIVAMAHSLDLQVIAESVETDEQLADLRAIGCDQAQGYLFARPLAPEQLAALLACQTDPAAAPLPA